jgi:hypothetical protein
MCGTHVVLAAHRRTPDRVNDDGPEGEASPAANRPPPGPARAAGHSRDSGRRHCVIRRLSKGVKRSAGGRRRLDDLQD